MSSVESVFGARKFGFGCMRLPLLENGEVNTELFSQMVDLFMERGFTYFDTAHGYVKGLSEPALKTCLTSRHPRESYTITDKLSTHHFNSQEEIRPLFESQLEAVGVDYFDLYLMHAQDKNIFEKFKKCHAYETALEFLKEGKIKHLGISFHDRAEVLEQILTEYPQIEAVQIQFNYADYEDPSVESRKCYEVCVKHGKPVIVMEPVKGGSLVNLPEDAQKVFDDLHSELSTASYAIRFAAGFDGIKMVLSGMGDLNMVDDNTSYMQNFEPLGEQEQAAVSKVTEIFRSKNLIPCTACRYCMEQCPKGIRIPDLFALLNAKKVFNNWNTDYYYNNIQTTEGTKAKDCLKCGKCEAICPQHLPIRKLLEDVSAEFDKD